MKHISLGGLDVSRIGLGTMGMSGYYTDAGSDDAESIRTIHRALDLGVTHIDTAEIYGPYPTRSSSAEPSRTAATRSWWRRSSARLPRRRRPRRARQQPGEHPHRGRGLAERLGTDHIDLYYQHRVDPNTPIEDTVGALAELVAEGKVRHIGLSEAGPPRSAAPTPCTRSPRCRRSTPVDP